MAVKLGELLSDSPKRIVVAADSAADRLALLGGLAAVNRQIREGVARRAAHVLRRQGVRIGLAHSAAGAKDDAGLERRQVDAEPSGRDRVHDFFGDDFLDVRAPDIDERRLTGHGDGLRQLADAQFDVDRGDERTAELDAVALGGAEPRQRERRRVCAREELDDLIRPRRIGDGRSNFLDKGGAGGLDSNPGKHGSRCVSDDAGNRRLGVCGGWHERQTQTHPGKGTLHLLPPVGRPTEL